MRQGLYVKVQIDFQAMSHFISHNTTESDPLVELLCSAKADRFVLRITAVGHSIVAESFLKVRRFTFHYLVPVEAKSLSHFMLRRIAMRVHF